jgi:hypothetical protein
MNILIDNMQWVLLVCGLMTASLVQGIIAPKSIWRTWFGENEPNPTAVMLMRSWSTMVVISGVFLIYAGFHPEMRTPALFVAGVGKAMFVILILSDAKRFLKGQAVLAVVVDSLMVVIFAAYLLATQQIPAA